MKIIKINPADNVAVAIEQLKAGETIDIEGQRITLNNDVPAKLRRVGYLDDFIQRILDDRI